LALAYYPNNINAQLLYAESLTKAVLRLMQERKATSLSQISHLPIARKAIREMNRIYGLIAREGYSEMPKEMYLN
jgi:hypothetical protein